MIELTNYQVSEQLHESANSYVYRGTRKKDDLPVILKVLRDRYPSPEKIAWFKREYEVTRQLDIAQVANVYAIEEDQHRWLMVLEDFGGSSLARLGLAGKLSIDDFLKLAIQVVDIIGDVHTRHIMHKDINPANIVLNAESGQVKLIDFGISTVLSRENTTFRNPNKLEGTLAYISPEQSGRMNRAMDYRTDFYSLGVTFYELLTGQLPFERDEALELVHAHIAKEPVPPHEVNPNIPPILSAMILKLMAKNAEERYQSAYGLKHDLQRIEQAITKGVHTRFKLGEHDISDRFQIPQTLYGREAEIDSLLESVQHVSAGASELVLVAGYSGVGKSVLVQEVHKPLTQQHGYFITGKFDQLQRDLPYSAFIQAFQALFRQLLTESEAQIVAWRRQLLDALGPNGQVIINVLPDVELIIGPQPAIPELSAGQAQNRFNLVFQNFIRVFTQPTHPLVIFLDDLQWADGASLSMLEQLITAPDSAYLLLIGAYRNNEVDAGHPLMLTLSNAEKANTAIKRIKLTPLTLPDVTQVIADTLHRAPESVSRLATLVHHKTGGNPFFLSEFLKSLYSEGLFNYSEGGWQWDLAQIEAREITDNVIELMAEKVQQLPLTTQTLLQRAACIGNRFDLQTLAMVSEKKPAIVALELAAALQTGLLLPLSDAYKLIEVGTTLNPEYKFAHDRVQQAVYGLIPKAERQAIHWQVGQLLLDNIGSDTREERVFDIVHQLNQATLLINEQAERDELARLNLIAAKKARASAAYQSALNYAQVGLELLDHNEDSWKRLYDLTLALHEEAAEAAYLSGHFEKMAELNITVLEQAATILDKVNVYETRIMAYITQGKPLEGIETALTVLKQLGVKFPAKPSKAHVLLALARTKLALLGKRPPELFDLPLMTDPTHLAAMRILANTTAATYMAAPTLMPLFILKQVNLSLKHGNAPGSSAAYARYGVVLAGIIGDIETGYEFAKLALRFLEQDYVKPFKSKVILTSYSLVIHWKEPLREIIPLFLIGHQSALESGDLTFAAHHTTGYCMYSWIAGQELVELEHEISIYTQVIVHLKQDGALYRHGILHQFVSNLLRQAECPDRLIGTHYNEVEMLPLYLETGDRMSICFLYLHKFILSYLFQEYSQAVKIAKLVEEYLHVAVSSPLFPCFYFYDSLAQLAVWPETEKRAQKQILKKVAGNQKKIRKWAKHGPMNCLHKWHLVEAERARVAGKVLAAQEHYDQAISLAHSHHYINDEALACELAGQFYLAQNSLSGQKLAQMYLRDAHYAYQCWGALAKVQHLEARYPEFLAHTSQSQQTSTVLTYTTGTQQSSTLDLTSVLKASQAISGEIQLQKLLNKLMHVIIENAGAEQGYLLLKEGQTWVISAQTPLAPAKSELNGYHGQNGKIVTTGTKSSLNEHKKTALPQSIINYVARTKKNVVLDDATQDKHFSQDDYIQTHQPKSVLCTPLINQGRLTGILYLENNLTTEAFTPDRLEVLNLLSSQAAISLENATLYNTLEEKVIQRTAQLADANEEISALNDMLKGENLRMSAELDVAKQIQMMILPKQEELEQIEGLEIAGYMEPADEVGGDYYDVLQHNGKVRIGLGDVTGHGLESGMVMLMTQSVMRSLLIHEEDEPTRYLNTLNRTIHDNAQRIESERNLTLNMLDYRPNGNGGQFTLSGAHEDLIVVRQNGEIELVDTFELGMPIGMMDDIADFVDKMTIDLQPDDGIVLYTDGVTEAPNMDEEEYGMERLCDVISEHWDKPAECIKEAVIADVYRHIGVQKVFDDITLLVVKQK